MTRIGIKALIAMATLASVAILAGPAAAATIFADFNTNEGPFNSAPTASGQTTFATTSTADRVTTDSIEGLGSEKLDLVDGTGATNRVRFLSGGGTHTNVLNTPFTLSAGTDGFIGYYYKVIGTLANAVGTTMSINLDGATGATAEMDGGVPKPINADGAWHLVEWNLDLPADWGAVASIGGGHGVAGLANTSHTVDSLYLQSNTAPADTHFDVQIDFVAKSDSGTIAELIAPEPASLAMLVAALFGACAIARTRGV
jgi:hypothetical protein